MATTFALCLGSAFAQQADPADEQRQSPGWRRVGEGAGGGGNAPVQPDYGPGPVLPSQLVLPAGTWITVRVNQPLSSDVNKTGEAFSATLSQPLVADGFVVARRGQAVAGRITDAERAGRAKGTSRLGIELIEMGVVSGRQVPVRTELIRYEGQTSNGRDVATVGTAAGLGAAIGAMADGGFGAGMGAIAGAAAGTIGVLATRGQATTIYPETALTFRLLEPVTISTERAEQVFQPVRQEDYEQAKTLQHRAAAPPPPRPPAYYPYWGPSWYYGPGYWSSGIYIYSGPRYYGRGYRRW